MTNLGITKKVDSGEYVVSFSKPQFQEFIYNLTSSPREETYRLEIGFDLTKSRIKSIVDKIRHQIKTQSELLSDQYTFTCTLDNKHEVTWHSYEQFFNTIESFSGVVVRVNVTATYMIGFNRTPEQKIERQVVSIDFRTAPVGWVLTRIMSTEITWPPAIYQLIERELQNLAPQELNLMGKDIFPFKLIVDGLVSTSISLGAMKMLGKHGISAARFSFLKLGVLSAVTTMQVIALMMVLNFARDRPMFNPETKLFERGTFQTYVNNFGLDAAVKQADYSATLYQMGYGKWADGQSPISQMLDKMQSFVSIWGTIIGLSVALVMLYCTRRARWHIIQMQGRISLTEDSISPREKPAHSTGILEAIMTGLFATAIWIGTAQILKFFS
ncbi:hypothetical protein [Fuscibacter oryzae]|uniref:Uncharacterized protein n=1 Tax=Fuscibacter oryzae TaxID=2803939 RepID=A0A8J7MS96_9RHOB|nr:hypothetical protein [Fuscibacter oryzae]MBL4928000.1 hypothetical protein [Fuscibacter oryzae]